jgi:hypothetical protein
VNQYAVLEKPFCVSGGALSIPLRVEDLSVHAFMQVGDVETSRGRNIRICIYVYVHEYVYEYVYEKRAVYL